VRFNLALPVLVAVVGGTGLVAGRLLVMNVESGNGSCRSWLLLVCEHYMEAS